MQRTEEGAVKRVPAGFRATPLAIFALLFALLGQAVAQEAAPGPPAGSAARVTRVPAHSHALQQSVIR